MIPTLEVKPLPYTSLPGLSENQLKQHHDVLYGGYVKKVNELQNKLKDVNLSEANATYSMVRELKLEETFAVNAVKLHEGYFANLGGNGQAGGPALDMINEDYMSYDRWEQDFRAAGMSARGWVVLAYDLDWNIVHNYSLDAHNIGDIFNAIPLLILDVYEHAYFIDYGTNRKDYINAFMQSVNWDYVNSIVEKYDLVNRRKEMRKAA
ncbi:MAG TPA: superoxide dismutase [Anaerolineae bacterium]|nr:superoxide dismutase [Anaerolineae bacterium]